MTVLNKTISERTRLAAEQKVYATIKRDKTTERQDGFPIGWILLLLIFLLAWTYTNVNAYRNHLSASAVVKSNIAANRARSVNLVETVDAVGITVSDMDRSVEFYSKVLSFEKVSDVEAAGEEYEHLQGVFGLRMRVVRMKLGDEFIELTEYLAPQGRPIPVDSRSNDKWFQHIAIITSNMERAYQWLRQNKIKHASTGPQTLPAWNKNAGGIKAFYFKDPDNHALEILYFPEGKGAAKWHQKTDKLFLGIDHTAIVVNDTEKSLKFYRDVLGFEIAGEGENYGTEQEHLNNVFGTRLRITALRAANGIGVEFLEYITPRDGRPMPTDTKASDLWNWQTNIVSRNLDTVSKRLRTNEYNFVSSGVVTLSEYLLGFNKGLMVRDPDGHAIRLFDDTKPACKCLRQFPSGMKKQ